MRSKENPPKRCFYCGGIADTRDHVIPVAFTSLTRKNVGYRGKCVPCCRRCNSILGDKVFDSLEERRNYVVDKLLMELRKQTIIPNDEQPIESLPVEENTKSIKPAKKITISKVKTFEITCLTCGIVYAATRRWQRFCSNECRRKFHRTKNLLENRVEKLETIMRDFLKAFREAFGELYAEDRSKNPE